MKALLRRAMHALAASLLLISLSHAQKPLVQGVVGVSITVSDMDRAVDFYSHVLAFQKVSDEEFAGERYERLESVFGLRVRVVRMRLGKESIELAEYLAGELSEHRVLAFGQPRFVARVDVARQMLAHEHDARSPPFTGAMDRFPRRRR